MTDTDTAAPQGTCTCGHGKTAHAHYGYIESPCTSWHCGCPRYEPRVPVVAEGAPDDETASLRDALDWLEEAANLPDGLARGPLKRASAEALQAALRVARNERDEALAALEEMRMRTPRPTTGRDTADGMTCEKCGLHPYDFTAGEYEDELKRIEVREAALRNERDEAETARTGWMMLASKRQAELVALRLVADRQKQALENLRRRMKTAGYSATDKGDTYMDGRLSGLLEAVLEFDRAALLVDGPNERSRREDRSNKRLARLLPGLPG